MMSTFKLLQPVAETTNYQLLSIVGPTATGKTKLALQLIKSLRNQYIGFDLISADSRQVYQGLEIISGADIPVGFKLTKIEDLKYSFFQNQNINIHGISIISALSEWSVAHFKDFAGQVINWSIKAGRLPIIVGGTGLYHQHLFNDDPKLKIKPNEEIRRKAEGMSVEELQNWLRKLDVNRFNQLNHSDVNNPTRLIRAIEIAQFMKNNTFVIPACPLSWGDRDPESSLNFDNLIIGLQLPLEKIERKIRQRVIDRLDNGSTDEVKTFLNSSKMNKQIMTATGVKETIAFLQAEIDRKELIDLWTLREYQYAKRQITWWKKRENINWFDAEKNDVKKIAQMIINKEPSS